jgi:hypothetical protein
MIGEGERDEAPPSDPTLYLRKDDRALDRSTRISSGIRDQLVAVRSAEGFKPGDRMKDGSAGVLVHQFGPPRIVEWIDLENG